MQKKQRNKSKMTTHRESQNQNEECIAKQPVDKCNADISHLQATQFCKKDDIGISRYDAFNPLCHSEASFQTDTKIYSSSSNIPGD